MSKRILSFVWFFIVILLFIFSVMYIKEESSQHNKQQIYNQWQYKYIVKTSQGSYVNTSANSKNRIALSEAQGYGMLIYVLNNQDKASESQFHERWLYAPPLNHPNVLQS